MALLELSIHQLDSTQIQSLLFAVLSKHAKEFSLFHAEAYLQQAANRVNRATLLQLKRAERGSYKVYGDKIM